MVFTRPTNPFQTVALGYSKFCGLFTEEEWMSFEYAIVCSIYYTYITMMTHPIQDLQFWYSNGPGQPTGAAIGIGYVQELVSRLTQTRITDYNSSVNGTIVDSNVTFPLRQPIYVDASHDTVIASSKLCCICASTWFCPDIIVQSLLLSTLHLWRQMGLYRLTIFRKTG